MQQQTQLEFEESKEKNKRWTEDENMILGVNIIRYMDQGYNQTEAGGLASTHVPGRTADACRAQWSSNLKDIFMKLKKYNEIMSPSNVDTAPQISTAPKAITAMDIQEFLQNQSDEILRLRIENEETLDKYNKLLTEYAVVKENLDVFVRVINNAKDTETVQ